MMRSIDALRTTQAVLSSLSIIGSHPSIAIRQGFMIA
jgi:hypothetical protein